MMECAGNKLVDLTNGSFDEQMAYIRNVEFEFANSVDELLEAFNLSYLRVNAVKTHKIHKVHKVYR
jgi:hypothetical protein